MFILLECPSCGQPVGHLWYTYQDLIRKYQNSDQPTKLKVTPEYLALKELAEKHGFDPERYCCRRTLECTYDATDIIN